MPLFRSNIRAFFLNANHIAGYVFKGVRFILEERGPGYVRLIMENNDYPIDHFAGFFQAAAKYGGLKEGTVTAEDLGNRRYAYDIRWQNDS